MHILVLGEGPNDLGRISVDGAWEQKGVVPILVERILREQCSASVITFQIAPWTRLKPRRGSGFDKKLEVAFVQPRGQQATAIVGFLDRDANRTHIEQLEAGRRLLLDADKPCAVGVAVEMLEALLLADEVALRTALNDSSIQCPPAPERLFKGERHAKTVLRNLILNSPAWAESQDWTLHYANIAAHLRLDVLADRCPQGFGPFAAQVRALAEA